MLSRDQIRHLANLARLGVDDDELAKLAKDLNQILEYVSQVSEVKLENVEPMVGGPLSAMQLRADEPDPEKEATKMERRAKIIEQFPEREGDYLKVPSWLEK